MRWSQFIIIVAVGLGLVAVAIWSAFRFHVFDLLPRGDGDRNAATVAAAIFAAASAGITLAAVWVAASHLSRVRSNATFSFSTEIMQKFRVEEHVDILRSLYSVKRHELKGHQDIHRFSMVLDELEWIGILIKRGAIPIDVATDLIGGLPLRAWYVMQDYVHEERRTRGHYAHFAEYFTQQSLLQQIATRPAVEWTRLSIKDRYDVDLVPELVQLGLVPTWDLRWAAFRRCLNWCPKSPSWSNLRLTPKQWEGVGLPGGILRWSRIQTKTQPWLFPVRH